MKQIEVYLVNSSEYCNEIFDGTHDSPKYYEFGYPLVTSKHLTLNDIKVKDAPLIDEYDYLKINKRSLVKENDVLISMIGTVGTIALIKEKPNFAIKNIGVMRAKNKIDAKYLYYYMQSNKAQAQIKSEIEGSTQPFLSLSKLRNFPIIVPTNENMKQHIVDTIGSVDDLIEKKLEILMKIEEISNIIFQNAVLNGNNITLSNFISFEKGRQVTFSQTGVPYLNIDSLELMPTLFSNDQGLFCNEYDILMVMDGATLAKIKTTLNSFYLYLYFKRNFSLIQSMNTGSAIPHANKKAIGDLIIKYNDTYNEKFEHLFHMWVRLKKEIQTLKIIKDKLIKKYF